MCLIDIVLSKEVMIISKKFLLFLPFLALILLTILGAFPLANQDFDGLFTMNVPIGNHYSDVAYCLPNGCLGCAKEYWAENTGCEIDGKEIVIYYYNDSGIVGGESNVWQRVKNSLTTSYLYNVTQDDGDLLILTNNLGMKNVPQYLVGVSNNDGSEAVFVGGFYLENLKACAGSVVFE